MDFVWVFHGEKARFSSGVFSELEIAKHWIETNKLSGILTKYPVNKSCYEWAIDQKVYEPKESDRMAKKMESFTSHGQEHYHFSNGIEE